MKENLRKGRAVSWPFYFLGLLILGTAAPSIAVQTSSQIACTEFLKPPFAEDIENLLLKTERLVLRGASSATTPPEIIQAMADVMFIEQVQRMSGDDEPFAEKATIEFSRKNLSDAKKYSLIINFAIIFEGRVVGRTQLISNKHLANDQFPVEKVDSEEWVTISIHLVPDVWNKGVGTETIKRLVRFAFENLEVEGVHASVLKTNVGSMRVFEKAGFQRLPQEELAERVDLFLLRD